jgi:hypothetical protein
MRLLNFQKKIKKSIFTRRCFKCQKNTPKVVTINFFIIFDKIFWRFFISLKWLIKD